MAKTLINLGAAPTGQGGDTFRTASQKNNDNTTELYAALGADSSGALQPLIPPSVGGTGRTSVGTAIGSDVTTGATSGTAGQLLKVSDFGIGSTSVPYIANVNEISKTGVYRFDSLNS